MLGFSLGKILVLVAIIAVVWYGFKAYARRSQSVGRDQTSGRVGHKGSESADETIQDMETCSVCGTFVPNKSARACGREGCPYPD